ncbi:MAG: hypothetical protein J5726_07910 [Treponema sp.]|nr:hypothetical protein [Treponema sp.]
MSKNKISLRTELLIGTIGSMVIITLFFTFCFKVVMNRVIETTTVDSVNQTMETLNKEVTGILGEYNDLVVSLSDGITYLEPREKIADLVNGMGKNMIDNTMLYYATYEQLWEGGDLYTSIGWVPPADFDMQSRLWHKNAVKDQTRVCYTEPYVDANTGLLNITLSYRVLDKDGKLIGIAAADIVLDALSEAVKNIKVSTNSVIHIVTKDGLYLTHDNSDSIMNENYFDSVNLTKFSKEQYLDGSAKAFTEGKSFYGVCPIANTEWFIVVEGPTQDFSNEYEKLFVYTLMGLMVIAVIMIVIFLILSARVSRSFKVIASGCELMAIGDYSERYPDYITKEASLLSNGFNLVTERLEGNISSMKQSRVSLNEAGGKLSSTIEDLMASIIEIGASISNTGMNIQNQTDSVEHTATSITKIYNMIHQLEELVQAQVKDVQGASTAVEQMVGNIGEVDKSVDKMATSFNVVETTAQNGAQTQSELQKQITEIENQSKLLSEANLVIASIAGQTNLLAMNAAIEAAHAGDAGQGFAVVADEIRKLSETSSTQSKTIGAQLKSIQATISMVVQATQRGVQDYTNLANEIHETDKLVQQIKAAMTEQQQGSTQILEALHNMNDSTLQVQSASQEMSNDSRAIIEEVSTLQNETKVMGQSMGEMGQSADKMQEAGLTLAGVSKTVEASIEEMSRQIDMFEAN